MIEQRHRDEWERIVPVLTAARGHDHVGQLDPEQADITEDELSDGTKLVSYWYGPVVYGRDSYGNLIEAVLDRGIVRTIVFDGAGRELQRWVKPLPGHPVLN